MVVISEEFVIRVVNDDVFIFLNYVQGIKDVDGVIDASLDIFEDRFVIVSQIALIRLVFARVLLHRLEVVELFEYVISNLCTGHKI